MYFRTGKSDAVAMGFFFFAQIFQRFVQNTTCTANLTMIKVAGKTQEERLMLSSTRATRETCSRFIWSWVGVGFLAILIKHVGDRYAYAIFASSMACLGLCGYMLHFRLFKGYEETSEDQKQKKLLREGKFDIDYLATVFPLEIAPEAPIWMEPAHILKSFIFHTKNKKNKKC